MFVKMLNSKTPISVGDNVIMPTAGEVIEVSNSVGTSLIRGGDAEQVNTPLADALKEAVDTSEKKSYKKSPKNKAFSEAPENK